MVTHEPHRSKHKIVAEILTAIKEYESRGGIQFTKILYIARLSSDQLKRYLADLIDNGLIIRLKSQTSKGGDHFFITDKGIEYLSMLDEMTKVMGPGLHL